MQTNGPEDAIRRREAAELATARNEWYIVPSTGRALGPYSEAEARDEITLFLRAGRRQPKLLRVVEDYQA